MGKHFLVGNQASDDSLFLACIQKVHCIGVHENSDQNLELQTCWILQHRGFKKAFAHTVKPVLSGHSKIDRTKVSKTNGSLMTVESIAECSLGAFCNTFDLHYAIIGLEKQILVFFLVAA